MSPAQFLRSLGCDYPDKRATSPKRRRLASRQAILRKVANLLQLPKGSYSIRSCIGGPAVEADAILHGENVYIVLNPEMTNGGYLRWCNGRRDYSGGRNYSIPSLDPADIANMARQAIAGGGK